MEHKSNNVSLAEAAYANALEAGEVGEKDKEAVIIGALWALSPRREVSSIIANQELYCEILGKAMEHAIEDQRELLRKSAK